ncbi:MAG: phage baseplate assembly protein V [Acidobacteriota bacterium]
MAMYGVYRGVVSGSSDPAGGGRVLVSVPMAGVSGTWAPVCGGGSGVGTFGVGSQVVVAFEAGDISHPIVLGKL